MVKAAGANWLLPKIATVAMAMTQTMKANTTNMTVSAMKAVVFIGRFSGLTIC
jgi:hypothetical protein